jgi:O-antigen/teichoic acid export membrane protein
MAQILPVIVSYSVFPMLIRIYFEGDMVKFKQLYRKIHIYYLLVGLLAYTFIYAFGDYCIPWAFGKAYLNNPICSKQMFLTILVFPTAFLQANMLVAMKLERLDMWYNVILLLINVCLCFAGLHFEKSLTAINIASFIAFLFFHVFQDIALFKRGVANIKNIVEYYIISLATMAVFVCLSKIIHAIVLFCVYWLIAIFVIGNKKTNGKWDFFRIKTSDTHAT